MKKKLSIILGFILLLIAIRHFYLYHLDDTKTLMTALREQLGWKAIIVASLFYILMLSIPFFPGVEIAWLMILIYGKDAIILVYFLTICGLCISFGIGRWFEKSWLTTWLNLPQLKKQFAIRTEDIKNKFSRLHPKLVSALSPVSVSSIHRYFILALVINLPGNTIIGGGGGISLICGLNPHFSWKGFITTLAIATAPMPLLLMLGILQIENLIS